jgi:hypothetical protein
MTRVRADGITIEYGSVRRKADPVVLLIMGFSGPLAG